jgi:hypothetical protein
VTRYLVERYLADFTVEDVRAAVLRLAAAADAMAAEGTPVRHVRSVVVWADEACYCELEAESPEPVAEANRRARFAYARIVAAERVQTLETRRT